MLFATEFFVAGGHVEGSLGAAFVAYTAGAGVARVGVGHYTVTLVDAQNFRGAVVMANPHGNANLKATTDDESDNAVKHVYLFDNAGAPVDVDFDFLVMRFDH